MKLGKGLHVSLGVVLAAVQKRKRETPKSEWRDKQGKVKTQRGLRAGRGDLWRPNRAGSLWR